MVKNHQLETLFEALMIGMNITDACSWAGMSRETYYKRLGADPGFSSQIERAQLKAKSEALKVIHGAAMTQWRAAAWYLERKYPKEYGPRPQDPVLQLSVQATLDEWKTALGIDESQLDRLSKDSGEQ